MFKSNYVLIYFGFMMKNITIRELIYTRILLVIMPLVMISCSDGGGVNLFSLDDDKALGAKMDAEIQATKDKFPIYNNAQATQYLQDIMNEIKLSKSLKHSDVFNYKIKIINDPKNINAFATAGGYVYIYTGLLKFVDNKAELASVIAHEMAHNDLRHASNRMTTQYGIGVLSQIIMGTNPGQLEKIFADIATNLGILKNSRSDEYQADKYAYMYLKDTKYYPAGMKYFFNKVLAQEQNGSRPSSLEMLFATHPYSKDRVVAIENMEKADKIPAPTEATVQEADYKQFKATYGF